MWFLQLRRRKKKTTRTESPGLPVLCCSQISLHRVFHSQTADKGAAARTLISSAAVAIGDMNVCYILDGILILYGVILTVLYCRLRMIPSIKKPAKKKQPAEGGIYEDLNQKSTDLYETIKMNKKPIV